MRKMYVEAINDYKKNNYCRRLTTEEANVRGPKTWTLSHHPVLNQNMPDKVSVVFNAAGKVNGVSLNGALVTGPDLLNSLTGVALTNVLQSWSL